MSRLLKMRQIIKEYKDLLISEIKPYELNSRHHHGSSNPNTKNKRGMTDVYLDLGTYIKSAYTILYGPSCVKIGLMGERHKRIHHKIFWQYAVPKIMREEVKYGKN